MIRLNDSVKTVIDETKINKYNSADDYTIQMIINGIYDTMYYSSKELRNEDIELLDKLFDVKNIEDKANAYPDEVDALKFAMSGIKQECEPKHEKYLTWEEVEQSETPFEIKMPNGDVKTIWYDSGDIVIGSYDGNYREARIYDADLFNALMLKVGD